MLWCLAFSRSYAEGLHPPWQNKTKQISLTFYVQPNLNPKHIPKHRIRHPWQPFRQWLQCTVQRRWSTSCGGREAACVAQTCTRAIPDHTLWQAARMTVGLRTTPLQNGTLSHRLRPLGQLTLLFLLEGSAPPKCTYDLVIFQVKKTTGLLEKKKL